MTTWTRAGADHRCGGCARHIVVGEPMQVLEGVTQGRYRCVSCADGPAPLDLPELVATPAAKKSRSATPRALQAVGTDWKSKASGDA